MASENRSQAAEPDGTPLQDHANTRPRILVVDDEISIRHIWTGMLVHAGYDVDAVENGAVAWDRLQLKRYDLVVTDNNMPCVSGVELIEKVHAARLALPIIMVSGALPMDEFTRNPWLQPAAMLLKPASSEEFLKTVKAVLSALHAAGTHIGPPPKCQVEA